MEIQRPKLSYLDHLKWMNSLEEGLDRPIMHSRDSTPPPQFKVRKAWFYGVKADLVGLVETGRIKDAALIKEIDDFEGFVASSKFSKSKPTTKEEIEMANSLIERVLKSLL